MLFLDLCSLYFYLKLSFLFFYFSRERVLNLGYLNEEFNILSILY